MCSTVVRRCSSAAMPLRRSNSTPLASRPSPSTLGPPPTETSMRSASTVSPSPQCTVSEPPPSPTFDGEGVRVRERPVSLDPVDAVGLEERRDAVGHLLDDPGLPFVRRAELELEATELHAELVEGVLGFLQREGGLHPGLRRDAADAQARAAELGLALHAGDLRTELRSPDRGRVTARPSSENGDVDFHQPRSYRAGTNPDPPSS